MLLVLSLSLLRRCHYTFNKEADVLREEWKLHKAEELRVLLTKLIFTQRTSDLKIYTKKPWIEDNSNTTNNNRKVELTLILVGALCHISRESYLSRNEPKI